MSLHPPKPTRRTVDAWIGKLPEMKFDGVNLYCRSCKKVISWRSKSNVVKHVASERHKRSVSGLTSDSDVQRTFNVELVQMIVGCNIPWAKLDNPLFRQFIQKCISGHYGSVKIPMKSSLNNHCDSDSDSETKSKIFPRQNEKCIWVSVEQTTNTFRKKMTNVLVGELDENCATRGHLIKSRALKSINSKSIVELVHSSLTALWGDRYAENGEKFLLFISDAAPYMLDAGEMLQQKYPNVLHITYLVLGLDRIAETVRECYPNVDKLICNVKETFLNAPDRSRIFCENLPNAPLPPNFNLARAETWLKAASYYYSNFDGIKSVLQKFNPEDAVAILQAQQAFMDANAQKQLEYIHSHFSRIPLAIRELEHIPERADFTTVDALNIIYDLRNYIFQLTGDVAERVKQKFESVLKDNPGFPTMSRVVDLIIGKEVDSSTEGINVASLKHFALFKYAPIANRGQAQVY